MTNFVVSAGQVSSGLAVGSGDTLTVLSGGTASAATVATNGRETVSSGGLDVGAVVSGGQQILSGGVASSTRLAGSATGSFSVITQSVGLGGSAVVALIGSGGLQFITQGGFASGSMISAGGFQTVESSGTASGTIISGGGLQDVFGGIAFATVLNGGTQTAEFGGLAMRTVVNRGGTLSVGQIGTASATLINPGGTVVVFGTAGLTGFLTAPTINGAGAVLDLQPGAVVSGGIMFQNVGGQLRIEGTTLTTQVISGFTGAAQIDLAAIPFDSAGSAVLGPNNQLRITEGGTTRTVNLNPAENFSGATFFLFSDGGSGTIVSEQAICFCRGTLILTPQGEVPVEELAIGDMVQTAGGDLKPIVWIGMGRDLVTRKNRLARPVIVRRGALGDGVPTRDLYLTHGHALYLDGVLVPVENLVNHTSIEWDDSARVVEYYHIELPEHDVLVAHGAPAESYYDAGNRALFHNAGPWPNGSTAQRRYAPVVTEGKIVAALWHRLFIQAGGVFMTETTADPDLHLVVDGERRDPVARRDNGIAFVLPQPPRQSVRLRSRSAVPSLLGLAAHDHRRLGVALDRITLRAGKAQVTLDYDDPVLTEGGCYPPERRGGNDHCWSDGDLALPVGLFDGFDGKTRVLVYTRPHDMRYPVSDPGWRSAAGSRRNSVQTGSLLGRRG